MVSLEQLALKLKLQNLLDETIEITRANVVVFADERGLVVSASIKYDFQLTH